MASHGGGGTGGTVRPLPATLLFNGAENEDWISFRDKFLTAVELNNYNDQQAKLGLKLCMKNSASRAVATIDHRNTLEDIEDVLTKYDALFMPPAASDLAINKFQQAKQQGQETLLQFHSRVAALFLRAYPDLQHTPALAIRVFGDGIRRLKVQEAVIRAGAKTMAEALQQALQEQTVFERTNPGAVDGASGYDPKVTKVKDSNISETTVEAVCYRCRKPGHIQANCNQERSRSPVRNRSPVRAGGRSRSPTRSKSPPKRAGQKRPFNRQKIAEVLAALLQDEGEEEKGNKTDGEEGNGAPSEEGSQDGTAVQEAGDQSVFIDY